MSNRDRVADEHTVSSRVVVDASAFKIERNEIFSKDYVDVGMKINYFINVVVGLHFSVKPNSVAAR